jgi:hypothetical protein
VDEDREVGERWAASRVVVVDSGYLGPFLIIAAATGTVIPLTLLLGVRVVAIGVQTRTWVRVRVRALGWIVGSYVGVTGCDTVDISSGLRLAS